MIRKFTSAEVEITAKDKTKPGIDSAKSGMGKLTGFVKSYGAELAVAAGSVYAAVKTMSSFVNAASESQTALEGARSAMKSHGTYTDAAFQSLQTYAREIQRVTTMDDDAALSLMTLGTNMGVSTDKIKQATEYAIGLSQAYGIDVNTAMRGVALAMEGQFSLLSRYIPTLRDAATEQEKMTAFTEAGAAGYQQAQDVLKTYAGQMQHITEAIKNIQEEMGEKLLPILMKVFDWVQKGIDWFNNLSPAMQNVLTIVGLVTAGLVALAPAIGVIITMAPLLGAAITIATGPIGIIIVAIAALAVGIVLLIKHWDEVKAFFVNLWEVLKDFWAKIEPFVAAFVPLYGIPKLIIQNWQPILGFFKGIGDGIQEFVDRFVGMIERLRDAGEKFVGVFKNIYDKLIGHSIIPEMTSEMIAELQRLNDFMGYDFVGSMQRTFEMVWTTSKSFSEKIKETFKNLIADFVVALAKQEMTFALMYTAFLQFGKAARHFATAAALYTASGVIRSLQKGGEFITNGPQLLMVGDNPSGREHVKVTPEESSEYNQSSGPMGGDVYFDGDKVGRWIAKQVRSKNIPIYKGALVSS